MSTFFHREDLRSLNPLLVEVEAEQGVGIKREDRSGLATRSSGLLG